MKKIFAFVIVSVLMISPISALALDMVAFNAEIDQTNFLVNTGCSGTLIDKERGLILTAEHCVSSQYKTVEREVIDNEGTVTTRKVRIVVPGTVSQLSFKNSVTTQTTSYVFKVLASDRERDLAIIQTTAKLPHKVQARLACTEPKRGDVVYVVGNPHGILYTTLHKGMVSSNDRNYPMIGVDDQGENRLMQVSAGIVGGNSGGAVYNDMGELVGVPVRGSRINEVLGFAAPLEDIKKMLRLYNLDDLLKHCENNR